MHWSLAVVLVVVVWWGLRRSVGAGLRGPLTALVLDFGVVAVGWAAFTVVFARPVLAALVILALAVGLAVVDRVKRAVLREPVLFADRAELLELVRHPQLYLPFAGTWQVLAGTGAAVAAVGALLVIEPPLLPWSPLSLLLGPALFVAVLLLPGWPPLLRRLARLYNSLQPTRDPARDAASFGLLASFVIHATLARAERRARQAGLPHPAVTGTLGAETIVLVQQESFFDVERLAAGLGAMILPHLREMRAQSLQHGLLDVPCWGANTIRSEFAVLTGLPAAALGLDRFNPYAAFARTRLGSLAWQARAAGFRTICVHPFDLGFYGRRQVLPHLGFDRLIGPEAFLGAARAGRYVSDAALAAQVAAVLAAEPGRVLVFAITMACHGPWDGPPRPAESVALPPDLAGGPEAAALAQFLFRLRESDAALPVLTAAVRRRGGVLALYGDHQPSLPGAFAAAGLVDPRTDYVLWRSDGRRGPRRDLAADQLGAAVLEAAA